MPKLIKKSNVKASESRSVQAERTWVSINDKSTEIITETRRTRSVNLSRQLALTSPLYGRLITALVDHIISTSMKLVVPRNMPKEYVDPLKWIWYTGPSALYKNARNLVKTLLIDGELILRTRKNEADGRVTLTNHTADSITGLKGSEGLDIVSEVTLAEDTPNNDDNSYEVIRTDVDGFTQSGEVFYFRMKPVGYTSGLRGLPLLMSLLDDSASATELTYRRVTRLGRVATHYWDVLMNGATQDQVDEFMQSEYSIPPESGEVFAHNEAVTWSLVGEKINQMDDELDFFVKFLTGMSGLSAEFIGQATGRDVTTEGMFAQMIHLATLQEDIVNMLEEIVLFVISSVAAVNSIDIFKPRVVMPITGDRMTQRKASAFLTFVRGMETMLKQGIAEEDQIKYAFGRMMIHFGLVDDYGDGVVFTGDEEGFVKASRRQVR